MKKRLTWQERVALDKLLEEIADELLSDGAHAITAYGARVVGDLGDTDRTRQLSHPALGTLHP